MPYAGLMLPLLPLVLFAATFSLALGLVLPLIGVERLFVFADEPSLLDMIAGLWTEGDRALAVLICLFSVVFPSLKLALLHLAAYGGKAWAARIPGWFRMLSNWSMLDVVLVALVIFAAKTSGLADAATRPGLWFFAASALFTAGASALARRDA
jgi:paraquat-inducible protein A